MEKSVEYKGDVVIGSFLEPTTDHRYRAKVRIGSGPLKNEVCYVRETCDELPDENMAIRIYPTSHTIGGIGDDFIAANLIRSHAPHDFEYAQEDEIALVCPWKEEMRNGFRVPLAPSIRSIYDMGVIDWALFYEQRDGQTNKWDMSQITPYSLFRGELPEPMQSETGTRLSINYAFKRYLTRMKKRNRPAPRVVGVDSGLESRIRSRIRKMGFKCIVMEPLYSDRVLAMRNQKEI